MTGNINPASNHFRISIAIDYEYQQIIKRLEQYGIKPSGNKYHDKMVLHRIELQEAKNENCVTNKFLTVTQQEQQRIQDKKKEKKKEINPEIDYESAKGQKILGEQIMLAIQMKEEEKKRIAQKDKEERIKQAKFEEKLEDEERIAQKAIEEADNDLHKKVRDVNPFLQ